MYYSAQTLGVIFAWLNVRVKKFENVFKLTNSERLE